MTLTATPPWADSKSVECAELPVFEEICPRDCLELLREEPVGHVALSANALPVVLPVNFAVLDGDIVWRSGKDSRLSACADYVVAFEVDHYEPNASRGWSVMVQGLAHVMTDEEIERATKLHLECWAREEADRYICLVPNIVTGTRITSAPMN